MHFVDRAKIHVLGGRGGKGCLSFRREKYVEMGGPDGGTGGKGGDVWIAADPNKSTLYDFTNRPQFKGKDGGNGLGSNMTGRGGEDLEIRVPPGTLIYEGDTLLTDLKAAGDRFLAAKGGRGGRGNITFKTAVNTAPRISEKGEPGEERRLRLELKLLADVGLLGFPNAGKSTFLSVVTKATPKIADYPFTTLTPNLGVCAVGDRSFVIADIPGIIEGAHTGRGLGDEFLRHVERTRVLIHLVDVFGFDGKTAHQNFKALNKELSSYSPLLAKKSQIVVASKMDLTGAEEALAGFKRHFKKVKIYPISAATGKGVKELLSAAVKVLENTPEAPLFVPGAARFVIPPDFQVEKVEEERFRIFGPKIERLAAITNFDQDEAVARLQKILKKMGVEQALEKQGIVVGNTVVMGDYEFTYRPEKNRR